MAVNRLALIMSEKSSVQYKTDCDASRKRGTRHANGRIQYLYQSASFTVWRNLLNTPST